MGGVGADEVPQEGGLAGQGRKIAIPTRRVGLERRDAVEVQPCGVEGRLVPQGGPVAEGAVAVVDGGIEVVHRAGALHDECSVNVHPVHDADGEGFGFIAVHVRIRPFWIAQAVHGQLWVDLGHDLQVARRQAGVGVIVGADHRVAAGLGVPQDLLVGAWNLSRPVVEGGVPSNLLPHAVDAKALNEGQGGPSGGVGAVARAVETDEVGWVGAVSEQSAKDGEAHRHLTDAVVVETTLPIGGVVGLEVQPEGLLVGAEIGPGRVVHGQVGFNANRVFLRGVAVEDKHLGDFGVDAVGGVVTDRQVLWVEELAHGEVALLVRQDVDGLERGRVVGGPLDVHLNRQVRRCFEHLGDGVDPIHMAREDGGRLSVQPQRVGHVEGDVGRHFVVFIRDTIVVAVPV